MAQSDHRKAVWTRPGFGPGAEPATAQGVGRKADLPLGSLPGQGDGADISGVRLSNGIFEPIWNRRYIDHVQISVGETVGVAKRGGYYDSAGALRDMVHNHIMRL